MDADKMIEQIDRDAGRITDADIEAISGDDPVWAVAERIIYENHGAGNAAVIILRYGQAAYAAGMERAAVIADGFDAPHVVEMANRIAAAIRAEKDKGRSST